jgi:hypothetical protein
MEVVEREMNLETAVTALLGFVAGLAPKLVEMFGGRKDKREDREFQSRQKYYDHLEKRLADLERRSDDCERDRAALRAEVAALRVGVEVRIPPETIPQKGRI